MTKKTIKLNNNLTYEILSKNQIIISLKGSNQYLVVDGVCFELIVSLMNLKKVSYLEFLITYSQKYERISNIKTKINDFLNKLNKYQIISY